ncbi:MAG TPA: hypothetical protein VK181_04295 [Rhizobium sp.]|nr:hypothetical protein [Rhizobium sp.]
MPLPTPIRFDDTAMVRLLQAHLKEKAAALAGLIMLHEEDPADGELEADMGGVAPEEMLRIKSLDVEPLERQIPLVEGQTCEEPDRVEGEIVLELVGDTYRLDGANGDSTLNLVSKAMQIVAAIDQAVIGNTDTRVEFGRAKRKYGMTPTDDARLRVVEISAEFVGIRNIGTGLE